MLWTCRAGAVLLTCFLLAGCDASDPQGPLFAEELGGPIPGLDEETLASFDRGRAVMEKRFQPSEGLGPGYNASSCTSCHFFPVTGGASDRHRDVFLLQGVSSDGTRVDYGTEDGGPLRKLYSIDEGHVAPPSGATVHVRRAALAGLGVGLFGLVSDEEILSRADPDDANGDGISGRASSVRSK